MTERLAAASDVRFEWAEVRSTDGVHVAVFRMFADAFKLDGVRAAFTAREAQEVADELGALLPTPKLLDLRFQQAAVKNEPSPKYYPGGIGMATVEAIAEHSARVEHAIVGPGIVANVGKHWVLHESATASRAPLYGWHVDRGVVGGTWRGIRVYPTVSGDGGHVIQPVSTAHNYDHADYSSTLLLVHAECEVDGVVMKTADVLRSPSLCGLAIASGRPLTGARLEPGQGTTVPATAAPNARQTLRRGATGPAVEALQQRLLQLRADLSPFGADGDFGKLTDKAVRAFQRTAGVAVDGVVGPVTWRRLDDAEELPAPEHNSTATAPSLKPLVTNADRHRVFGNFAVQPIEGGGGAVNILGSWVKDNIITIEVPQLRRIPGVVYQGRRVGAGPSYGRVACHRLVAEQLRALWQAWEDAGLLEHVMTWEGLWVPRYVRGSTTTLSNHCFGTAFDINAAWNALGATPTPAGKRGSVEELVPLATEHGFFWGGHFRPRADGMHFEVAKVL